MRRQHQQSPTPCQVQPPSSQTISPMGVSHQVTIESTPSVISEMSCLSEHDSLFQKRKGTPPRSPCDIVFKESPLLTVKSHDNVSVCLFIKYILICYCKQ